MGQCGVRDRRRVKVPWRLLGSCRFVRMDEAYSGESGGGQYSRGLLLSVHWQVTVTVPWSHARRAAAGGSLWHSALVTVLRPGWSDWQVASAAGLSWGRARREFPSPSRRRPARPVVAGGLCLSSSLRQNLKHDEAAEAPSAPESPSSVQKAFRYSVATRRSRPVCLVRRLAKDGPQALVT